MQIEITDIIKAMQRKNYAVFSGHLNVNLVGIRNMREPDANTFNDLFVVFYSDVHGVTHFGFDCSTDPGSFYRKNPLHKAGTAQMVPGQYRGAYELGLHKGYEALVQKKPINFWRNNNRDDHLQHSSIFKDVIAANIHRANAHIRSVRVDKWSAGCQVLADPLDYSLLIALCAMSARRYGNSFTYTLLTSDDLLEAVTWNQ